MQMEEACRVNGQSLLQPFRARDAGVVGIKVRDIRSGEFRRISRSVYVNAQVPDDLVLRAHAALLGQRDGIVISHQTAAQLWGGSVRPSAQIHLAVHGDHRIKRSEIKLHRYRYPMDTSRVLGLPVTSPLMTFAHLARDLDLIDLVALGDSLVRAGRLTPEAAVAHAQTWPGQMRHKIALASALIRSGVDSPQETRLRLLLTMAGLPEPTADIRVTAEDGTLLRRLDLGYAQCRLAVEYDGRWHLQGDQPERDRVRKEDLQTLGWDIITVDATQLYEDPEAVVAQVHAALRQRRVAVRRLLRSDWQPHFSVVRKAA
jgi:hypothetical protein